MGRKRDLYLAKYSSTGTLLWERTAGSTLTYSTKFGVIAGVDWVKANHAANPTAPAVANMSLAVGASSVLTAVKPNTYYKICARAVDAALNLGVATISVTTK